MEKSVTLRKRIQYYREYTCMTDIRKEGKKKRGGAGRGARFGFECRVAGQASAVLCQ